MESFVYVTVHVSHQLAMVTAYDRLMFLIVTINLSSCYCIITLLTNTVSLHIRHHTPVFLNLINYVIVPTCMMLCLFIVTSLSARWLEGHSNAQDVKNEFWATHCPWTAVYVSMICTENVYLFLEKNFMNKNCPHHSGSVHYVREIYSLSIIY